MVRSKRGGGGFSPPKRLSRRRFIFAARTVPKNRRFYMNHARERARGRFFSPITVEPPPFYF
jgi:hypothetical protein